MEKATKKAILDYQDKSEFIEKAGREPRPIATTYTNLEQTIAVSTNWAAVQDLFNDFEEINKENVEPIIAILDKEPTVCISTELLKNVLKLLCTQKEVEKVYITAEKDKPIIFRLKKSEGFAEIAIAPIMEN